MTILGQTFSWDGPPAGVPLANGHQLLAVQGGVLRGPTVDDLLSGVATLVSADLVSANQAAAQAAASAAVLETSLVMLASKAAAELMSFDEDIERIVIGFGAAYVRVESEPSHLAKLQTADGDWWEYELKDGYAHAADFGDGYDGLVVAWSASRRVRCTPGVDYTMPASGLVSNGEAVHIDAPHSRFLLTETNARLGQFRGGWEAEQDVSAISGAVITVENGVAYSRGDKLKLICDLPLPDYVGGEAKMGEFVEVSSVSGNNVTLTMAPYYTYDTGENCRVARIKANVQIKLDIGEIVLPINASRGGRGCVTVYSAVNPVVNVRRVPAAPQSGAAIILNSCLGGSATIDFIDTAIVDDGYGILFVGSERCEARVKLAGAVRHSIDAGGAGGDGTDDDDFEQHGATAHCRGFRSLGVGGFGPFASHHGTRQFLYEDCIGIGCQNVVGFRGVGNIMRRCISYDCRGNPFGAFRQYAANASVTDDTLIEDCVAIRNHARLFDLTHGNVIIRRGSFEMASDVTSSSPVLFEGANVKLEGRPKFIISGTASQRVVLVDGLTTEVDLGDAEFILAQTGALTRFLQEAADVVAVVKWDGLTIDKAGSGITSIYGDTDPAAGSRFGNLTVRSGGFTNLCSGYALSAVADHIFGTIRDFANRRELRPQLSSVSLGTMTTGTLTLDTARRLVHYTNNGAHTLAPPSADCDIDVLITNASSAGAITTSGFSHVVGDGFTTTSGKQFLCRVRRLNGVSILDVKAMP